jgi:serine protease Do
MNRNGCSKYACFITVLLALLVAPAIASAQQTSKPAPPAAPAAPSASQRLIVRCGDVDLCAEQIQDLARTISQDVVTQLSDLKEEIATEVQMSSPELSKLRDLSVQLAEKRAELAELGAEIGSDMAARGRELAQQIQEQTQEFMTETPGIRVRVAEEGGGWLGIEIGEVTQEKARELKLSSARGVVVTDVEPDSPAAKASLKEKDVITQFDGQIVEGTVQFRRLVHETPAGRTVSLAISRDGGSQNIFVELGDRSAFFEKRMKGKMRDFGEMNVPVLPNYPMPDVHEGMDRRTPVLGVSAEDLTGQLGEYFGAPDNSGVLVREVRSGTPAEKGGLKAGDVIVKLNDKPVHSLADLRGQLRENSAEKSVTLGVLRKGSPMTVTVPIELPRPGESMHHVHRAQS